MTMEHGARRRLGRSAVEVSQMGFGGAPLGNLFKPVAADAAQRAIDGAYDLGLRYFDTAPLYGHGLSERRLGEALRSRPRESFVLSTKVGRVLEPGTPPPGAYVEVPAVVPRFDYSEAGALRSLEESLARLGLDRVDVLYIHDIDRFTHGAEGAPARFREAMAGAYRTIERLRREGQVRAIGIGVNEWEACQRAAEAADFDCFLLAGRYTLLEQEALESFLPLCERRGIGVVIGGPLNSGILATGPVPGATYNYRPPPPPILERAGRLERVCASHGVPLAAAALQFPLAHPAVACVIPGARSLAEVAQNVALLARPLPTALWRDLKAEGLLHADAPTPAV
jgi:D-threo-aldose 1-dehydrogenase